MPNYLQTALLVLFASITFPALSQSYTMSSTTENVCSGQFYDTGGPSGAYQLNENITMTFCACNGGQINIRFTAFDVENGFDALHIYDGPSSGDPLIGSYDGTALPPTVTSSGSCITFVFESDGSVVHNGWAAEIRCLPGPVITPMGPTTFCQGDSVVLSAETGTAYEWSTGATTQNITVKTAGNYSVDVTSSTGCKNKSANTAVTVLTIPAMPGTITGQSPTCAGSTQPYSVAAVAGATTYDWTVTPSYAVTSGQGTNSVNVKIDTIGGTISVNASNQCGSSGYRTKQIAVVFPLPVPGPITGPPVMCTGTDYVFSIPGIPTATTYTWTVPTGILLNSGQGTTAIDVTALASSGNLSVTATNACGVTPATSMAVSVGTVPPVGNATITGPTTVCANSVQTYISSAVTGATYYRWTFPSGSTILSGQGNDTVVVRFGAASGAVTVMPTSGCDGTATTVQVTVSPAPQASAGPDMSVCRGDSVTLTASGGGTYLWSPSTGLSGTTTAVVRASPAASTPYILEVTNTTGCKSYDTVLISVMELPVADAGPDAAICQGQSTQLLGSGGVFYEWTPATGLSDATSPSPVASPSQTTGYVLVVTDANGCSGKSDVTVSVNPLPAVSAGPDTAVCSGESLTLTATGAVSYTWNTGAGSASITEVPMTDAFYVVTGTASGCSATDSVHVTVYELPLAGAGNDQAFCQGQSVFLSATGLGTASWSPVEGLDSPSSFNPTASPSVTTEYILTVLSAEGCEAYDTVLITVLPSPQLNITGPSTVCEGGQVTLTASGAENYLWDNGSTTETIIVSPVSTTIFTLTAYIGTCGDTATHTVVVSSVHADAGPDTTVCLFQGVQLQASGGTFYQWTPEEGLSDPMISNPVASPLMTTLYSVLVLDDAGCYDSDSILVTVDPCGNSISAVLRPAITVYPNPAGNTVIVQTTEKLISARLINASGQEVQVPASPGTDGYSIDLRSIPRGFYTITLELQSGIFMQKLVCQ